MNESQPAKLLPQNPLARSTLMLDTWNVPAFPGYSPILGVEIEVSLSKINFQPDLQCDPCLSRSSEEAGFFFSNTPALRGPLFTTKELCSSPNFSTMQCSRPSGILVLSVLFHLLCALSKFFYLSNFLCKILERTSNLLVANFVRWFRLWREAIDFRPFKVLQTLLMLITCSVFLVCGLCEHVQTIGIEKENAF